MYSRHVSYLRRILKIPTTWGSIKHGAPPTKNEAVLSMAGLPSMASLVAEQQMLALGHLYRSGRHCPQSEATYD
eukprot:1701804-Alexandrium_andersonii.AAC.1